MSFALLVPYTTQQPATDLQNSCCISSVVPIVILMECLCSIMIEGVGTRTYTF